MENIEIIEQRSPRDGASSSIELRSSGERLRTVGFYRQELGKNLDPDIAKPYPLRLVWYAASFAGAIAGYLAIVHGGFNWPGKLACALFIGFCNGILGFIFHELMHGSIVKSTRAQNILGFFCIVPFFVSPTFWRFWHNRLHHGKTQQLIQDPDAFPNLRIYKSVPYMKFVFPFTPGSGHKRSYFYFFYWFTFHVFSAQSYLRFRNGIFAGLDHRRVTLEWTGQLAITAALLAYAGPSNWIWTFVIPFAFHNYMLMSYISTNHNISPLTNKNDPLVNSLTVTNHPILEFLHLNFGYHVEHHIFPNVSGARIKAVHHALVKQFPDVYQIMPKWQAIRKLYATPRIYKNASELIHPETLEIFETLGAKP